MKRTLLPALGIVVLALACSAPSSQPSPSGAGDGPAQPKVNRVVLAVPAPVEAESNQPRNIGQTSMWQIAPMYEYLIAMDNQTGKYVPGLATEWKVEENGSALRFKLRQGVQFHSSTGSGNSWGEFTAKDMEHSWKDMIREDSIAGYQVVLARRVIDRIEAPNDYEVVMRLKAKDSDTLNTISQAQGGFEMMSKANFDKTGDPSLTQPPIAGTGPYQFKSRSQGANVIFERVPYKHWRMMPDFPEFEFRFIKEASTRQAALMTHEIQLTSLPNDLMAGAERAGLKVAKGRVPALRSFLSIWCCYLDKSGKEMFPDSPLKDVRVRKALNKAINRDELNKAFFAGKGELIFGFNHVPANHPAYNPDWQKRFQSEYGYDPNAAKDLLSQAGYGPGKPFKTVMFVHEVPAFAAAPDTVEAIASFWRQAGVDVTLSTMEGEQMRTLSRGCKLDNHFDIIGTSGAPIVAYGYYNSSFIGNCGGYQHPDTDALFDKIRQELDIEKHDALWRQIGDKSFDLHTNVPLFWLPAEAMYDPNVVSDYVWPGSISGTWTHVEQIKAAR